MRFTKIEFTKKGVECIRAEKTEDGSRDIKDVGLEPPLPEFRDALTAFLPYVRNVLGGEITFTVAADVTVTKLHLSRSEDGRRGLMVTVGLPISKAAEKPMTFTTPLVYEAGESTGPDTFVLTPDDLARIDTAEKEALRYINGERAQVEMFDEDEDGDEPSENVKAVNERMAAAEVASTRKPRASKKKEEEAPSVETDLPPLASVPLQQLLRSVDRDVPIEKIEAWSATDAMKAQLWARARQSELLGSLSGKMPAEPACVSENAIQQPKADDWTSPVPPAAENVEALAVQ